MKALHFQRISRDPEDGLMGTYECQRCLRIESYGVDMWDIPDYRTCCFCGHDERNES